jgi:hypothetical protein
VKWDETDDMRRASELHHRLGAVLRAEILCRHDRSAIADLDAVWQECRWQLGHRSHRL